LSLSPRNVFRVASHYQPLMRQVGLDADVVFSHPEIRVWRALADRENCTLDATLADGSKVRLHIKRYPPARRSTTPADDEANGLQALGAEQIPTAPLVGWGKLGDGRSFVITEDLYGYQPADKLIAAGEVAFDRLIEPTADVAAKLHGRGLHHRDLYLCHFFVKADDANVELRLIDAARAIQRALRIFFRRLRVIIGRKPIQAPLVNIVGQVAQTESIGRPAHQFRTPCNPAPTIIPEITLGCFTPRICRRGTAPAGQFPLRFGRQPVGLSLLPA